MGAEWSPAVSGSNDCFTGNSIYVEEKVYSSNPSGHTGVNYAIPAILSFIGLKYIQEADDPVINLCTNMSIISSGIYLVSMVTSGIFIGRLPIYASLYSYILLPWEIEHIFMRKSARLVTVAAVVAYCGFFYYQMHMTWDVL